jgi:diacylglycerol kinase (ATP)
VRVRVVVNPVAGGGKGIPRAERLVRALGALGHEVESVVTRGPGHATELAGLPGADVVVSVGGDGSANEAANGLAGATLAILPIGTANVVARELGIPSSPEKAAALIHAGNRRTIDTGVINGRRFLQSAGCGFDAAVVEQVHARRGKKLGYIGYVIPTFATLASYTFPPVRVIVDGRIVCGDAQYAVAGNCVHSAGAFPLTPEAALDSGVFDVCAFRNLTVPRMARLALASFRKGFSRRADVVYTKGTHVRFEPASEVRVPLQIDGDPAGELPATFDIAPASLEIIAP